MDTPNGTGLPLNLGELVEREAAENNDRQRLDVAGDGCPSHELESRVAPHVWEVDVGEYEVWLEPRHNRHQQKPFAECLDLEAGINKGSLDYARSCLVILNQQDAGGSSAHGIEGCACGTGTSRVKSALRDLDGALRGSRIPLQ